MMSDYGRISVVVLLAVLGDGAAAYAQGNGHFNRVTTTAYSDGRSSSTVNRVARAGGTSSTSRTVARADSLHPYSSQTLAQAQTPASQAPSNSSWAQEPQRPAAQPKAAAPSRPRTYYPGLRPGLAVQQPVTLTAGVTGIPLICTPSRNHVMSGAGHHR